MSPPVPVVAAVLTWAGGDLPEERRSLALSLAPLSTAAALRAPRRLPLQPSTQPRPDPVRRGRYTVWQGTAGWATTREFPGDNPVTATLLVEVHDDGSCAGVWVEDHREVPLSWASAAGSCADTGWSLALVAWAEAGVPAAQGRLETGPVQRP